VLSLSILIKRWTSLSRINIEHAIGAGPVLDARLISFAFPGAGRESQQVTSMNRDERLNSWCFSLIERKQMPPAFAGWHFINTQI